MIRSNLPKYVDGGSIGDDFNTRLSPAQERAFQVWKAANAPNDSGADYDLRGAYLANMQRSPENGHMGDQFKKPNHPTFSDQSQYAVGDQRDRAGSWVGPEGPDQTFVPPAAMRASGGRTGYADGGAPDLPDAPWVTAAPHTDLPDAPWAAKAPEPQKPQPPTPGDIGSMMPEAYQDPNRGVGATLAKAAKSIPHSAAEFGHNMVQPFIHPVDTLTSMKNLGMGVLEKTGVVPSHEHEKYADAVGKFFADRYGGLDKARQTLETDPVGMAGDLSMLLTGGGGLAARGPGIVGKVGEVAGAAGRAVDPLRPALAVGDAAVKAAGKTAAQVAGVTTGAGALPLETAARAGYEGGPAAQAFRENLTGAAPLEGAVNDARGAVRNMRAERGSAYREAMEKLRLQDSTLGEDNRILDFGKVDQAVEKVAGVKTFKGQDLSPATKDIRGQITTAIEDWKNLPSHEFHTVEGMDALKQKLGDIRDATLPNTPARVVADQIYHGVRQTIIDQAPEYAKIMKGYEEASKQIREIETTLSLKPNANVDTALRKLQSALRDNVNTSFGRRTELANYLVSAGAPHLMERLAGQALHAWAPRGLARLATMGTMEALPAIAVGAGAGAKAAAVTGGLTLPMMSPRLMGNAAYGLGAARRYAQPVLSPMLRPARQIGQITGATNPFGTGQTNPYQQ